jgi:hypothetical protein
MAVTPQDLAIIIDDGGNIDTHVMTVAEAEASAALSAETYPGWGWYVLPAKFFKVTPEPEEETP